VVLACRAFGRGDPRRRAVSHALGGRQRGRRRVQLEGGQQAGRTLDTRDRRHLGHAGLIRGGHRGGIRPSRQHETRARSSLHESLQQTKATVIAVSCPRPWRQARRSRIRHTMAKRGTGEEVRRKNGSRSRGWVGVGWSRTRSRAKAGRASRA
jgi:hypothetical protein